MKYKQTDFFRNPEGEKNVCTEVTRWTENYCEVCGFLTHKPESLLEIQGGVVFNRSNMHFLVKNIC